MCPLPHCAFSPVVPYVEIKKKVEYIMYVDTMKLKSTYDPKHNKLTVHLWTGLNTDPRSEAFISTSAIVFDT